VFALKLSFVLRYQMDILRSVVIPLEKLADIDLAGDDIVDKVMASVINDDELMQELFGDYMYEYRSMAADSAAYWKDLMRFQEELVLIPAAS
jgi:hypothetical protein